MAIFRTLGSIVTRKPAEVNMSTATPDFDYLTRRQNHIITFRHPGYAERDNELFRIPALDHADGGLHHGLAVCMCGLIADNRKGYLALTAGGAAIEAAFDDVLPANNYYFHVISEVGCESSESTTPYKWPVVTCFLEWQFPKSIPEWWTKSLPTILEPPGMESQSNNTSAVNIRDKTCRVSNHRTGTEVAYLCPESETPWFVANNMSRYKDVQDSDAKYLLKDPANTMLLRSDIHNFFDDRGFILFPKGPDGDLVVHMLQQVIDMAVIYHNVELQSISGCRREFVLTRLAWAIFPRLISTFFSRPTARLVVKVDKTTGERSVEEVTNIASLQARAANSRSHSPKKRHREGDAEDVDSTEDRPSGQKRSRGRRMSGEGWDRVEGNMAESSISSEMVATPPLRRTGQGETLKPLSLMNMLREDGLRMQRNQDRDIIEKHARYIEEHGKDLSEDLRDHGFEVLDDSDEIEEWKPGKV